MSLLLSSQATETDENTMPNASNGCATVSDTEYAARRRKHLNLIKQLRAIGAQADLDLPRIVVIGNQSAGKSSLVEAISGINVPRDAGTCTRCPIECRLASSSDAWSCQVFIRWDFDAHGQRSQDVSETAFGPLIINKSDVELALRRAQCAVLNPTESTESFVNMSAKEIKNVKNHLKFSANTVCMDLKGPGLTDLAFVDLPGIIQNADPQTVKMVEDMVVMHIEGNCLILLTIPMSDDIENQKAARLAQQVDPTGQRTIGVLTKPDTLTAGAIKSKENWLALLEGQRGKTVHGYFCTRQPDDDERARGITPSDARATEKTFFNTTSPWSTSTHRDRFGTESLVDNLARLLSNIIDETLPKLQSEVAQQLIKCSSDLATLPPPVTSDPTSFVLNLVLDFYHQVKRHVEGDVSAAQLVQQNRRAYATFKRNIRDSALLFLPYANAEDEPHGRSVHEFFRSQQDSETSDNTEEQTYTSSWAGEGRMYLADVQRHIRNALTRELPDNVPYAVKVMLIQRSQKSWESLSEACFDSVRTAFETTLGSLADAKFNRYHNLHLRVMRIVTELVRKQADAAKSRLHGTLELERVPYTQNQHYLQETKAKYLALYKDARAGKLELPAQLSKGSVLNTNDGAKGHGVTASAFSFTGSSMATIMPASTTFEQAASGTPIIAPRVDNHGTQPIFSFGQKAATRLSTGEDTHISTPTASEVSNSTPSGFGSGPSKQTPFGFLPQNPAFNHGSNSSELPTKRMRANNARPRESDVSPPSTPSSAPVPIATTVGAKASGTATRTRSLDDEELEKQALSALAALGYHVTATDLGKLNPPDVYESEMELMAEVRAYLQIAYKRVIDYVPMTIDHGFLFGFAGALQQMLIGQLGLGAADASARCAAYLAEDARVVGMRDELLSRKRRLESVQAELDNFGL